MKVLIQKLTQLNAPLFFTSVALLGASAAANAADVIYQAEDQTWSQAVFETVNAGYTGTGYVNTDNISGSYVEFTIEVPSDGSYSLAVRYANGSSNNRPVDLSVNGEFKLPQLLAAPTGSWSTWTNEAFTLSLVAGSNTIRMIGAGASGTPNIDALRVTVEAATQDVVYEAENQSWSQAVFETLHAGFTGTGYVNTDNVAGSYIEFTVSVPAEGNYNIAARFANGGATARPADLSVNGEFKLPVLNFVATGAWTTWTSESVNLYLVSGTNTVRIISQGNAGAPNIDSLTVTTPQ